MTNALWYLGRGTGVSALVLFTIVMVLGVVVRSGRALPGLPRYAVAAVHRTTSLTALGLLAVHVVSLLFDPFAGLRLVNLVLPFTASYRPLWVGLGTLAAELVVLLIVSSLVRQRLGRRSWRILHWSAYACWPLAMGHAIGSGTDGGSTWLLAVVVGCAVAVGAALTWRVSPTFAVPVAAQHARQPRPPSLTGVRR